MTVPAVLTEGAREDGAEVRVFANLGVEGLDQAGDVIVRDQALRVTSRIGTGWHGAQRSQRRGRSNSGCGHGTQSPAEHLF